MIQKLASKAYVFLKNPHLSIWVAAVSLSLVLLTLFFILLQNEEILHF